MFMHNASHSDRTHTHSRHSIREKVLQALYAYELSKEPIVNVVETVLADFKSQTNDFEFAKRLIIETVQHEEELEKYIKAKVAHWEMDRMAVIDRLLLRMGICELMYFPDIPPKVTINEVIEVAKTFSTEQSGKFVNGVLDAILNELKSNKLLVKTGRGLIEESSRPVRNKSSNQKTAKRK